MIQDSIDHFITARNRERDAERGEKKASGSSLGKCLRQLMLMEHDCPSLPFTAQQLRVFHVGYLIEKVVMDGLRHAGKLKAEQVKCEYRGIRGVADGIIEEDGRLFLFDCKSVNSMKFDWLDKEGIDKSYIYQTTFYWMALTKLFTEDPVEYKDFDLEDDIIIAYVEKESILVKEMHFKPSQYIAEVDAKITAILDARKDEMLPPEKTSVDWECFSAKQPVYYKTSKPGEYSAGDIRTPGHCKIWCRWIKHCHSIEAEYAKTINRMGLEPDPRMTEVK